MVRKQHAVSIEGELTNWFSIQTGVKHDVLYPQNLSTSVDVMRMSTDELGWIGACEHQWKTAQQFPICGLYSTNSNITGSATMTAG